MSAGFAGGDVTSDGGITLLRQTDRRIGLSKALAKVLPDPRDPERIEHPVLSLVRQRIYGLAQGYEDRRGGFAQHKEGAFALEQQLPVSGDVPSGGCGAGQWLSRGECCPRHADKQRR